MHIVPANQTTFAFRPDADPVLRVRPGEIVRFETSPEPVERLFAAGSGWTEEIDVRALNTLTVLKNPSIYAHQLNLANQQIVNNTSLPSPTPAPPLPPHENSLESTPLISQALIHPPDLQSVHPSAEDQIPAATPALGISNNLNSSFGTIRAEPNGEPETENLL